MARVEVRLRRGHAVVAQEFERADHHGGRAAGGQKARHALVRQRLRRTHDEARADVGGRVPMSAALEMAEKALGGSRHVHYLSVPPSAVYRDDHCIPKLSKSALPGSLEPRRLGAMEPTRAFWPTFAQVVTIHRYGQWLSNGRREWRVLTVGSAAWAGCPLVAQVRHQ